MGCWELCVGASHWLQKHWFVADMILEVQGKVLTNTTVCLQEISLKQVGKKQRQKEDST